MTLANDVRFGLRRLRRTPLFSLAVLITLAVAIAANVAVFSAVRTILLRPLPIQHPDRVVFVQETGAGRGQPIAEVSHRNFVDWRAQSQSFASMAAISSTTWSLVFDRDGEPVRVAAAAVSASFFDLLGVSTQLGRTFTPADDLRGAARVLILSDGLWRRVFHADPHAIGMQVPIDGKAFTIVGVMPAQFSYPAEAAAWTPVVPALEASNAHWKLDTLEKRFFGMLNVVGRLKPGVSQEQARAELDTIVRRLPEVDPQRHVGSAVIVTPLLDHIFGPTRRGLILLFAMVCLVLLIACANVASLVLARAATLRGAFAIKSALGASRAQLVREWVVEIGLVTVAASAFGILLAWVTLKPLLAIAPSSLPHLDETRIDLPVLAFALGLCLLTTVLCAFVPALIASARGARDARLQARSTSDGPRPLIGRGLLTAMQIALATVLLTGAGLLVRSFDQLRRIDPGFEPRHLLTLGVEPQASSDLAYRAAYDAILARVASLPGVEAVGAVSNRPLGNGPVGDDTGYLLEGQTLFGPEAKNNAMLNFEAVTPGYFAAMRTPVHRGRDFSARDTTDAPSVAIVSESTARRLWPGQDAVGKRLTIPAGRTPDGTYPMQTVIGVVADVRYRGLDDGRFDIYMTMAQAKGRVSHLMIRTANDPASVAASVRAAIGQAGGTRVLVESIDSMDRTMADAIAPWRFSMTLLAGLAVIGVLLAIAGLFALVAYAVAQRTPEFAIRLAIGAEPGQVLRMVLWQSARVAVPGLIVGLLLSLIATSRMSSLLFQVSARDLPTFTTAALLLGATAGLASYLAARRVIRIDPLAALRDE